MEAAVVLHVRGRDLDSSVLGVLRAVRGDPMHVDRVVHGAGDKRRELGRREDNQTRQEEGASKTVEREQDHGRSPIAGQVPQTARAAEELVKLSCDRCPNLWRFCYSVDTCKVFLF